MTEQELIKIEQMLIEETKDRVEGNYIYNYLDTIQDKSIAVPEWAMGPFKKDLSLTFEKKDNWIDPLHANWKCSAIFNPSVIEFNGVLYLIYRAAPAMETADSRIGVAYYKDEKWTDCDAPIIFKQNDNESLGCEDPKVYKVGDIFYMFYNGAFLYDDVLETENPSKYGRVGVDICVAESKDLLNWEKKGVVVPREITKNWAKGAVIPRNAKGEAVKIGNWYYMFISEGCGGKQVVGRSKDFILWEWDFIEYCDFNGIGTINEIACCATEDDSENFILDVYFSKDDMPRGAQVLYSKKNPFKQLDIHFAATYSWGGISKYKGKRIFAQGWEALKGKAIMYFYVEDKN